MLILSLEINFISNIRKNKFDFNFKLKNTNVYIGQVQKNLSFLNSSSRGDRVRKNPSPPKDMYSYLYVFNSSFSYYIIGERVLTNPSPLRICISIRIRISIFIWITTGSSEPGSLRTFPYLSVLPYLHYKRGDRVRQNPVSSALRV